MDGDGGRVVECGDGVSRVVDIVRDPDNHIGEYGVTGDDNENVGRRDDRVCWK